MCDLESLKGIGIGFQDSLSWSFPLVFQYNWERILHTLGNLVTITLSPLTNFHRRQVSVFSQF